MKVYSRTNIQVGEVAIDATLRLDAMLNIFQEIAIQHTHEIGVGLKELFDAGKTWVLSKIYVQVATFPKIEQTLDISTWSRGVHRFKGLREYEICLDGESVIRATSLWVYVDVEKRRPIRVPKELEERYGIIDELATDVDIEGLDCQEISTPVYSLPIAIRVSDFDINGHVNNAVILQYIETALFRYFKRKLRVTAIEMQFQSEIPMEVDEVIVHLQTVADGCLFSVKGHSEVHARGKILYT